MAPPAPLSFLLAARMPLHMATPACSEHHLRQTLPEATKYRGVGGTAPHRHAPAGHLVHSFELYERNMEVVYAHVFHSGIVSVAHPTPDAPPKLTPSTWSGSIRSGSVSLLQHTLPQTAEPGELLECIAVHPGPPVHSDVGQYAAALQVRPRRASAPAPLPYSCSTSTPGPPHHRCTQSWKFSLVSAFPESARHGRLARSATQRSAMHRRWPLRASASPPVQRRDLIVRDCFAAVWQSAGVVAVVLVSLAGRGWLVLEGVRECLRKQAWYTRCAFARPLWCYEAHGTS